MQWRALQGARLVVFGSAGHAGMSMLLWRLETKLPQSTNGNVPANFAARFNL
jgi:hypothetical protein